ncbi:MAG: hypothetical protein A2293_10585 [Elusimicrobia bacterium RIFOXYB2_FULL_49_7]|nr:MAG: hypothetical protein A2293_10585 [Elusimicrobia bacterium RIFOXYB2_FULL_49_7]
MNQVNIAVVGLRFGNVIVQDLLSSEVSKWFNLVSICDLDIDLAKQVSAQHGGLPIAQSLDALLTNPTIHAIALMTPPGNRAALIQKIIRSGRHVMTTKPFERNAFSAEQVLAEAKSLGKAVHLNSPSTHPPPFIHQIREWVDKFNLGRIIGCRAEMWAYKPRAADHTWYDDPEQCPAAPIFRIGIYLINYIIDLLGEPDSLSVMESRILTGRPTPDNAQMSLQFRNGALGNIFVSFCIADGQDHRPMLTLNFERATIYVNICTADISSLQTDTVLILCRNAPTPQRSAFERAVLSVSHSYHWEAFYRAVQGNDIADDSYRQRIVMGIKVLEAMARAEKSGRIEPIV